MTHRNNFSPKHSIRYYDQWMDTLFFLILILLAVLVVLISIFVNFYDG